MEKRKIGGSLAIKLFAALLLFVVLPLYLVTFYVRARYESYFRQELSSNIAGTLAKSETEIEGTFDKLLTVCNILCTNTELQKKMSDAETSYYQRMKVFDEVVNDITLNNVLELDSVQITMVDGENNVYSNWSLNFNDYSFLTRQNWVRQSIDNKGHLVWGLFTDPFIKGDDPENKYIGLTRGIKNNVNGTLLGTVIITVRQSELSQILQKYQYTDHDHILVCNEEGKVLLKYSTDGASVPALEAFAQDQILSRGTARMAKNMAGKDYLVSSYPITKKWIAGQRTLHIYHFTDYSAVNDQIGKLSHYVTQVLIGCMGVMLAILAVVSWSIVRPIKALSTTMTNYRLEQTYALPASRRRDEIGMLNRAFIRMDAQVKQLFDQLERENRIKEQYKLNFLRAQINPHFLFNTLNMIRWMALVQHMPNIVESIDALGSMLRYSMNKGDEMVTIQEELQNLNGYIRIQNYRYGNRYRITESIPPALKEYRIIRFALQPVVENAVLHAFSETQGEGVIAIGSRVENGALFIEIQDNGKGISPEQLAELTQTKTTEDPAEGETFNKIGICNVNEQIKIRYGEEYGLSYESDGEHGTKVIYRLPLLGSAQEQSNEKSNDC